jgi:hypothetical protein
MHERRAWQAGPALLLPHIFNFSSLKQVKDRIKHVKDDPGAPLSMPPYGSHYRGGEIPGRWQNYAKTLGYYSSAEASLDLSVCFTASRQIGDIVLVAARELPLFGCSVTALQGVGRPSEAVRTVAWISTCLGHAPRPEPPPPKVQKVRVTQTSKTHMPGSFSSPHPLPLFLLALSASIGRVQ